MQDYGYVAIVSLLALLAYFWMGLQVGRARAKSGIAAPAMTGDPVLERTIRAHYNTLEWLPLFLAPLWLFAIYWSAQVAAAVGLVWIIGRVVFHDPGARGRRAAVRRARPAGVSGGDRRPLIKRAIAGRGGAAYIPCRGTIQYET
jgi:uncharacterized membrane protein YecN with MAPEG domain